jgi:hypothetical protein
MVYLDPVSRFSPDFVVLPSLATVSAKMKQPLDTMEKASDENVEAMELKDAQKDGDYAGAVAKTDPIEIRLVRKLDYRIMVSGQTVRWHDR